MTIYFQFVYELRVATNIPECTFVMSEISLGGFSIEFDIRRSSFVKSRVWLGMNTVMVYALVKNQSLLVVAKHDFGGSKLVCVVRGPHGYNSEGICAKVLPLTSSVVSAIRDAQDPAVVSYPIVIPRISLYVTLKKKCRIGEVFASLFGKRS